MSKTNEQVGQVTNAELQRQRNLKVTQTPQQVQQRNAQKQQYAQKLGASIKKGQYTSQKTDAQKKQALQSKQKWNMRMLKARKQKGKKKRLAKKYEKIIRKYNRTSWILLYVAAFADALFDLISVPVVSTVLSFGLSLYINIALWNIGAKKDRNKKRLIRASASILDLIPVINWIPITVIIIYNAKQSEEKRVRKAKKKLKKLN